MFVTTYVVGGVEERFYRSIGFGPNAGHAVYLIDRRPYVIDEQTTIAAPTSRVWHALVDAADRRRWWSYLELDAVVGGRFIERWMRPDGEEVVTSGVVAEATPPRILRLTWSDQDWPADTDVEITLGPLDGGTVVRVRHLGWDRLPDGSRLVEEHRAGWRVHLTNLRNHAEGPSRR